MDNQEQRGLICCKHGKPCRIAESKSKEKRRDRKNNGSRRAAANPQYENVLAILGEGEGEVPTCDSRTDVTDDWEHRSDEDQDKDNGEEKPKSEYENVPDGGLGAKMTPEEEGPKTAKDGIDIEAPPQKPKKFKRSESQQKVVENRNSASRSSHGSHRTKSSGTVISADTVITTDTGALDRVNAKEGNLINYYIGPCTPKGAEQQCTLGFGFRLYHSIVDMPDSDALQCTLPLFIVCQTTRDDYRHIRILRSSKGFLRVDLEGEPQFHTLSQLITFYDIYAAFDNNMEPFPNKHRIDDGSREDDETPSA